MKKRANELNGSQWTKYSISVWNDIRKTSDETRLKHPAMFPETLINRLLSVFTNADENTVLDPFMGSGSTLLAAKNINKSGIGFETNKEYIEIAKERLAQQSLFDNTNQTIYHDDSINIPKYIDEDSVDICIKSPPYWDILSQKRTADKKAIRNYGSLDGDISRISDYEEFISALCNIFTCVYKSLKPSKYCIVNVMDIRKKDKFYPLHSDLANKMQETGFIYDDLIIWDRRQEYNNLRCLGYPYVFRLNRIHEYLLIFKKPEN